MEKAKKMIIIKLKLKVQLLSTLTIVIYIYKAYTQYEFQFWNLYVCANCRHLVTHVGFHVHESVVFMHVEV